MLSVKMASARDKRCEMICTYQTVFGQVCSPKAKFLVNQSRSHIAVAYCTWKRVSSFSTAKNMAFGALSLCVLRKKKLLNKYFWVLLQVLREAVADSVVEVEDVGVAEGIVEAEAVGGVDVRGSRFKPDFYSYWFWGRRRRAIARLGRPWRRWTRTRRAWWSWWQYQGTWRGQGWFEGYH